MPTSRRLLGNTGENLAAKALQEAGLMIIERNWRCNIGEIDLVAEEQAPDFVRGGAVGVWRVLIEVRTRRGQQFGTARQSIIPRKAAKLRQLGAHYVQATGWLGPWRIDVVAIQMDSEGRLQSVEHIRGAITG